MLIAINWFVYIYGVNSNQVIETSLGYFINPLISVLFGVFVFHERLRRAQWIAIGIGAVAVAVDRGRLRPPALDRAHAGGVVRLVRPGQEAARAATDRWAARGVVGAGLPALGYLGVLTGAGRSTFTSVSTLHTVLLSPPAS